MARLYAQFGAVVFLAVGLGGLLTGDGGSVVHHHPQGNFGPMALHLTYVRDVFDLVIGGVLCIRRLSSPTRGSPTRSSSPLASSCCSSP